MPYVNAFVVEMVIMWLVLFMFKFLLSFPTKILSKYIYCVVGKICFFLFYKNDKWLLISQCRPRDFISRNHRRQIIQKWRALCKIRVIRYFAHVQSEPWNWQKINFWDRITFAFIQNHFGHICLCNSVLLVVKTASVVIVWLQIQTCWTQSGLS